MRTTVRVPCETVKESDSKTLIVSIQKFGAAAETQQVFLQ